MIADGCTGVRLSTPEDCDLRFYSCGDVSLTTGSQLRIVITARGRCWSRSVYRAGRFSVLRWGRRSGSRAAANPATSSRTPPAPTCSPAHPHPARQQTPPTHTPAIPARPPQRNRNDQADQPQHHPAATGPAASAAPPAAAMPAPRKTAHHRPRRQPPSAPMTQRDSRSGQHSQRGQQPSAGTTDSYEILASAPKITLATLPSTERQCRWVRLYWGELVTLRGRGHRGIRRG